MMNQSAVEIYISELPFKEAFDNLDELLQTKVILEANKQLVRHYGSNTITDEMVALQAVFMAEAEVEGHAKFHRQGVTHMRIEDITFTYDPKHIGIAPEVQVLVEQMADSGSSSPVFGSWL